LAFVACKHDAIVATEAGVATTTTATTSTQSALSLKDNPDPFLAPRLVLKKWNDAHNTHDAKALEALYAPSVKFYGQTLAGAECAKRKAAAFVNSTDYAQTILGSAFVKQSDGSWLVRFTKTSTTAGKSTDYPSFIVVASDHVSEESDKVTDENLARRSAFPSSDLWCFDPDMAPNNALRAPFTIGAAEAWGAVWSTKTVSDIRKTYPEIAIDTPVSCPSRCGASPDTCGLQMRVEDAGRLGTVVGDVPRDSLLIAFLYVDAEKRLLWSMDALGDGGFAWKSEPLTVPKR
jgi:hypothetical protein